MKNKGFSLLEATVSITIVSIFLSFLFPLIQSTSKLNNRLYFESICDRDERSIINLVKDRIANSQEYYREENKKFEKKEKIEILKIGTIKKLIPEIQLLKNRAEVGNTLLTKLTLLESGEVKNYFIIFQFNKSRLLAYEGEYIDGIYFIKNKNELIKKVRGEFKREKKGVIIEMEMRSKKYHKYKKFREYENL